MVTLSFSVVLEMGPHPLVPFVPLHSFNIDFKEPVDYSFMLPLLCADVIISLAFLEWQTEVFLYNVTSFTSAFQKLHWKIKGDFYDMVLIFLSFVFCSSLFYYT